MAFCQESIAEVGADESGSTGDEDGRSAHRRTITSIAQANGFLMTNVGRSTDGRREAGV
jgi:hypothetical protein